MRNFSEKWGLIRNVENFQKMMGLSMNLFPEFAKKQRSVFESDDIVKKKGSLGESDAENEGPFIFDRLTLYVAYT